jgi:hypothetical protein
MGSWIDRGPKLSFNRGGERKRNFFDEWQRMAVSGEAAACLFFPPSVASYIVGIRTAIHVHEADNMCKTKPYRRFLPQ